MDQEKEHNNQGASLSEKMDSTIDSAFERLEGADGPSGNSSPETPQADGDAATLPDSASPAPNGTKTGEDGDSAAAYEGVPKGFAEHPSWKAREAKIKEHQARAQELERSLSSLLSDPEVLAKHLKRQGYSDQQVQAELFSRGLKLPGQATDNPTKRDQVEAICSKLGWDAGNLNQNEKAYIADLIKLSDAVAQERVEAIMKERLGPMESYFSNMRERQSLTQEFDEVKKRAKGEFPDLDWDKDVEPAMNKYLDHLDQTDPQGRLARNPQTVYVNAMFQILKEKKSQDLKREERDKERAKARPLVPGVRTPQSTSNKGKNWEETLDKALDARGFRG